MSAHITSKARRGTSVVLWYGERYGSVDPCAAAREAVKDIAHYLARDWGTATALGVLRRAVDSFSHKQEMAPLPGDTGMSVCCSCDQWAATAKNRERAYALWSEHVRLSGAMPPKRRKAKIVPT